MLNLFDEIIRLAGLSGETVFADFRYVVIGGNTCYVEQHKGVYSFDPGEVVINLKRVRLSVVGKNFVIKRLTKNDLILTGEIVSTTIIKPE